MSGVGQPQLVARQRSWSLTPTQQDRGENEMRKLLGWDNDREVAHQLLSWVKQNELGED